MADRSLLKTPLTEFARWQTRSPRVDSGSRFRLLELLDSCLFQAPFEIREIVSRDFGERCRFDARSQPHGNLGRPIGERLEQNDATRKIVRDCLPRNSPLRNPEHDLQNGPLFFTAYHRSEREMSFVDSLKISQRWHESGQLFEARAVGVNIRHGSIQDDRIGLAVRIEWREFDAHGEIDSIVLIAPVAGVYSFCSSKRGE